MMHMKKMLTAAVAMLLLVGAASIGSADSTRGSYDFKEGSEAYFCQCDGCACDTISNNPGKCTCGVDLAKGGVKSVAEDESVAVDLDGKEKTFKTGGKFVCACPPACTCNTVSQNPGNCTCGKAMKEIAPE